MPKVGDIVQVIPGSMTQLYSNGLGASDPVAAIITRVWDNEDYPTINVVCFRDANNSPMAVTSVQHTTKVPMTDDPNEQTIYWYWV